MRLEILIVQRLTTAEMKIPASALIYCEEV